MKNRKASKQQITEDRNALYHKVILRNIDLGKKNTELSHRINVLENNLSIAYKQLVYYKTRRRWWQFWKWFN